MSSDSSMRHILVINQHGENRGDEAAMRAMLDGFESATGGARYTVVVQFQDISLSLPFRQQVTLLHLKMPPTHFLGLVLYGLLRAVKIDARALLTTRTQPIVAAYESADLIVSAPGGPYFGDIYANHEIVHWFYVWLAKVYSHKLFLYAPSAGPFRHRLLNPIRRWLFRRFDAICVREELSRDMLVEFLGEGVPIHVTADSAIQQVVPPMPREQYFGTRISLKNKLLVAVSAIQYKFPDARDPEASQARYNQSLLEVLNYLSTRRDCHFLLIPQLYGKVHSDVPYLEFLASQLPSKASWEIVDQQLDSDAQRSIFGMSDICIASRYHPQIFAATAGVPGICIYYEHKALGFMRALGIEDFAFDIRAPDTAAMCAAIDRAIDQREALSQAIWQTLPALRERARMTTRLAVELLNRKDG